MDENILTVRSAEPKLLGRVVVVLENAAYRRGKELWTPFSWWQFAERFAAHCQSLTLYIPISDGEPPNGSMPLDSKRLSIEGRFYYTRVVQYHTRIARHRGEFHDKTRRLLAQNDLVVFRYPSPIAMRVAKMASRMGKPTAVLVGGDLLAQSRYAAQKGVKQLLFKLIGGYERRKELNVAAKAAFVGAWGEEMYRLFSQVNPRTALAADPNISETLITSRADTCNGSTIRVVRVAKLHPNKGLEYLMGAIARLRAAGFDVRLDMAGSSDDPAYEAQLKSKAHDLGLGDNVTFYGNVPFGPQLFELYRNGDMHVLSSLAEGLPRCIVEGRVFGLPTVATSVGGIPTVVQNEMNGLLVPPSDVNGLADAMQRLISDSSLRQKIIANGYAAARVETGEFQAKRLATLIARSLEAKNLGDASRDVHKI